MTQSMPAVTTPDALYRDLLKRALINLIYLDAEGPAADPAQKRAQRLEGTDWPPFAVSMVGWQRLSHLEDLVVKLLDAGVPGDFMETGVWRGGASILMRGVLKSAGVSDRKVWLADSFEGLPPPKTSLYPADAGDQHHQERALAVGLDAVRANFDRFGLLDDQVCFWKGFFSDNLHLCPVERLALLRLDADMYEGTIVALRVLYDRLSPGGYVVIDDYGYAESCRRAVGDFLSERGLSPTIIPIDWTGAYFQKP